MTGQLQSRKWIFAGLIIFPAVFYGVLVIFFAVNIPVLDDYGVFLGYLNSSITERGRLLLAQHNEHRLFFTRAIAEIMFQMLGYIDFRYLVYIGNMALLGVFFLLICLFKRTGSALTLLLPVPYLLFFSPLWENMVWATGSIQNYYVLLFALLSLFFFEKRNSLALFLSLALAILAVFTSGAGLLIFIVLIVWSLMIILDGSITADYRKDQLLRFLITILVTALIYFVYFYNYVKYIYHPSIFDVLQNLTQVGLYYFILVGSYTQIKTVAFVVGVSTITHFAYLSYQRYNRKNPVIYYFLLFLVLTTTGITFNRFSLGLDQALHSRYVIISILMLVFLYMAGLETIKISPIFLNKLQAMILILILVFCVYSSIANIRSLSRGQRHLLTGINRWQISGDGLVHPNQNFASQLLQKAVDKGYYHLPP